jgi:MiaB/RimO family radical SAM methylthiotransferase
MKKAFIYSNNDGCQRNLLAGNLFKTFFLENNFRITNKPQDADFILLNTCAFTTEKEDDCINAITKFSQIKKTDAKIVVCGCLPSINGKRLRGVFKGSSISFDRLSTLKDVINSKTDISEIPNNYIKMKTSLMIKIGYVVKDGIKSLYHLLGKYFSLNPAVERLFFSDCDTSGYASNMFYIKIAKGCRNTCTYCAIKRAKGDLKSRPISTITNEFRRGISEGYTRFMLVAEDVGCYGVDRGGNLIELLRDIFTIPGNYTVSFNNIHPKWLMLILDDLMPFLKTGKIGIICVPVQSGSDRILSLMGRGHNIRQFKEAIHTIRKEAPAVSIKTHLMVGFPGETDKCFKDTVMLLDEIKFDHVVIFEYSSRPGTISSTMINPISDMVKRKRYRLLNRKAVFNKLSNKIRLLLNTFG